MMRTYVKGLIPNNSELSDKFYINDIDRVSPGISGFLSDSEARIIIKEYNTTKDLSIRNKIIHIFGKYVVSIAKNYQNQGLPLGDLISEGVIGLIYSIENFDSENPTQFMTYSGVIISRQMREALDLFNLPTKVPKNIRNKHRKVKTLIEQMQLEGKSEDEIQMQFIDDELGLEYYYNPGLFTKFISCSSIDEEDSNSDGESLFISDDKPDAKLIKQDLKKDINRIFRKRLTKTEAKVLRLYFGLDQPYRIVSTTDLGKRLGISGERARQIKEIGLHKLRDKKCKDILTKYL